MARNVNATFCFMCTVLPFEKIGMVLCIVLHMIFFSMSDHDLLGFEKILTTKRKRVIIRAFVLNHTCGHVFADLIKNPIKVYSRCVKNVIT